MADLTDEDFPGFLPLANYRGLEYGPNFRPSNEGSNAMAIDGTLQKLRDPDLGSPFTFRVRPPAVLVNALRGKGGAHTRGPFDPFLEKVFQDALAELQIVESRFLDGLATQEELEAARAALLGGRPQASQNVNIIETAQRANNNFQGLLDARDSFDARNFTASSNTQGSGVSQPEDLIAGNGVRFNPNKVGQSSANQLAVSDLGQARDALSQLNQMLATPALTLLINPEQLQITYTKKQTYQDRNRFNYVFQSWGEEQVRLSITGKSAGFVTGSRDGQTTDFGRDPKSGLGRNQQTAATSGYQYASKWDSAAWQNMMGLFAMYRNNGYIYDRAGNPGSEAHLFIGNIEITYDQWVYVGNFENFNYQYTENKQQGAVEFSCDFVASFIYDRSQAGDITKIRSPTPSPDEEAASAETGAQGLAQSTNSSYSQTTPPGFGGAPSTAILGDLDPFQNQSFNPFQGPELAPGVFAPPGSTVLFPGGSNNGNGGEV